MAKKAINGRNIVSRDKITGENDHTPWWHARDKEAWATDSLDSRVRSGNEGSYLGRLACGFAFLQASEE